MGAYEVLACERVLRGALAAGQEREGELATTTLEFEYLHGRCEMLIGRDNISNDVITLGTCFSMFFYIRTLFRFELIGENLTAQSTGSHRGIGGGIQTPAGLLLSEMLFLHLLTMPRAYAVIGCTSPRLV